MVHDDGVRFGEIRTASGHVFGHARLNAPASLNALSLAMIDSLAPQLQRWAEDPRVAGVLLDGAGDKAFCAGGDVVALYRAIRAATSGEVPAAAAAFFEREYRLDFQLHQFPKPVLCWGHGVVMGGGIGLMAGASHRVATPRTRLAMPEIGIGLFPDVGGSWFLRRMPGRTGLFLALTGAPLNAADARFAGLADAVLPHEQQGAVLEAIAQTAWSGERQADGARLSHLLQAQAGEVAPPESLLRRHFDLIDEVIGHDALADIAPRLRALATHDDPWLANAGKAFAAGSPTSAALSFALWQRARHLSLAEVFRLEYQVAVGCCLQHDFAEGVRALLVDKDKTPRWSPATLAEITDSHIAEHFRPRFNGPHPLADLQ
ncbi:enoyl-CoA hydratase/isomerase family protein [Aquabacterium sp.]|uniref:enoyl-CoA hydratase/isomerase family protein n=1 Tax=Aquabacterium sp. TaxID=1872578 RepID=UPI002CB6A118|nr:enoyl-CoA hydratase/isomerase family protein [Aquabacterium sp.]HSW03904.1 enoyl-CoA hydratase/isomerase family protein [Aquabacterium sp.]